MEIILATQNSGKIEEFNELAKDTTLNFVPVPSNPSFPEETGSTFFENASIKANFVFSLTGKACLGDERAYKEEWTCFLRQLEEAGDASINSGGTQGKALRFRGKSSSRPFGPGFGKSGTGGGTWLGGSARRRRAG